MERLGKGVSHLPKVKRWGWNMGRKIPPSSQITAGLTVGYCVAIFHISRELKNCQTANNCCFVLA
jgi:hypothetical protein